MRKKIVAALAAFAMILGAGVAAGGNVVADVLSISASAADSDYTRKLNDDGTVTITEYTGTDTDVVIPDTIGGRKVTAIGKDAFRGNNNIKTVTTPNTLKSIGSGAFYYCFNLEKVNLNSGLTQIDSAAFYYCKKLNKVNLPNGITKIPSQCFDYCESLSSIEIPNSVTEIDSYAFRGCENLSSVTMSNNITVINQYAFSNNTSLKSIVLPNSVKEIGYSAFSGCKSITSINIPSKIDTIPSLAFYGCESLKSITIPSSVTTIDDRAFENCKSLSSLTLNEGLKSIGYHSFYNCTSLKAVTLPKSLESYGYQSLGYYSNGKVSGFKGHCYYNSKGEECFIDLGLDYDVHTFGSWTTTKEASYTSAGQQTRKCKTCSLTETKTIAKKTLAQVKSSSSYTNATDAIRVNWNKVTGADGYIVERSTDGKTWTRVARIADANTLNYRNSGLKSGTKYLYRVKAFVIENGVAYYSDYSSTITAWTKPAAPKAKTEYTYATDAIRVNWNKSTGAEGYIVERSTDGKTWTRVARIADANTLNYRNSGLKSGTKYLYRVKAFTIKNGMVSYSPYSATITAATKPAATKITKNTKAATAVRLYWNKVNCTGYKIQQYKNGSWVTIKKVAMGTTNYRVEGLKKNTSYKFRIQPYYSVNGKILYGSVSATYTAKTTN